VLHSAFLLTRRKQPRAGILVVAVHGSYTLALQTWRSTVSFLNATSTTSSIPRHWRRSFAAYLLLLAVVAAANLNLAHTRIRSNAVPSQSKVADANHVTTPAAEPKARVARVTDARQAGSPHIGAHD
jgi:hypothetical protein